LDYKDVENGPLTEANRECRDIFCCLLFLINIVWMCYATGIAYNTGNPSKIFRAVSTAGEMCGYPGTLTATFPYAFYANPLDMTNKRYCVQSCPSTQAVGTTLTTSSGTITFTVQIDSSGTASGAFTSADYISYDSSVAFDRVCIPSTAALNGAFSTCTSAFSSLKEGDLGNFILDVKNVLIWLFRTGCGYWLLSDLPS
jgi:hypothetical protein